MINLTIKKPFSSINPFFHLKTTLLKNNNKTLPKFVKYDSGNTTVEGFINAVTDKCIDDAKLYLSKDMKALGEINIWELHKVFEGGNYKELNKARFLPTPNGIKTNSLLVMKKGKQRTSIVHVHMIKEPDLYGMWKICGIEKE